MEAEPEPPPPPTRNRNRRELVPAWSAPPTSVSPTHRRRPEARAARWFGHLLRFRPAPTAESRFLESSPELYGSAQSLSLAPL